MKKSLFFVLPLLSSLCVFFSSCMTIGAGSGKEKVLTTFMDSGSLRYYIRPAKMLSLDSKKDKACVLIDFTYQKEKRDYVSDAYVNFSLYYGTRAFVSAAAFILPGGDSILLQNIATLDRNVKKACLRTSTVLEKASVKIVLEALHTSQAILEISLDDGTVKHFRASKDLVQKIEEAFSK